MKLFDVYPLFDIEPVAGAGSWIWDKQGTRYLDLYGGHAVISIGHSHPHYIARLKEQMEKISFYSNSVVNKLQEELAEKLEIISGVHGYQLFLVNSGAEAIENALKCASFHTGRKKIIAFKKSFHGRTSGAVAITDNPAIVSPFNANHEVVFIPLNDTDAFSQALTPDVAAVIVEGIQGVGGIHQVEDMFLQFIAAACEANGTCLILDEIQSGYGRTGKFFAHQYAGIRPHFITMAKGMGNGFPVGGVLLREDIQSKHGMLGTTFGGNYLAMAACLAVLEVMDQENLMANAVHIGSYFAAELVKFSSIEDVRGRGLMIGFDVPHEKISVRKDLLMKHHIFTGEAKPNTIRLLPSLALRAEEAKIFIDALKQELE